MPNTSFYCKRCKDWVETNRVLDRDSKPDELRFILVCLQCGEEVLE